MKAKLQKAFVYLLSPKGKTQIHQAVTALLALYIALHRAGV